MRPGIRHAAEKKQHCRPPEKTNPCYICRELGHWAPECPQKQDPAKKVQDPQKRDSTKKAKTKIRAIFVKTLDTGLPNALTKKIFYQAVIRKNHQTLRNRV